jgi:hypothetical protein
MSAFYCTLCKALLMVTYMTHDEITKDEIQIIKWGEKIVPGLIVLVLFALIMGAVNTRDVVAGMELKMSADDKRELQDKAERDKLTRAVVVVKENQSGLKLKLKEMEIKQEFILEDVGDIKEQNQKILDILTGNGH